MPFVATNGVTMFYTEQGSGLPLLLIMGITATGAVWEKHADYWSRWYRCIMPDNRGVGQTSTPEGPYTSEQMADDYAGLLNALRIDAVAVVGCSMGSIVAQQLALRHPSRVKALVLMCPWARCDARAAAIFQHMVQCKAALGPEGFSLFIQLLIYAKAYWDSAEGAAALQAGRSNAGKEPNPQSLAGLQAQAAACINHDVLKQLPKITQPALIVGGREDIFTPVWMAAELAENIPNASLHLYDNCGHAFHWEALHDFNPRILKWLSDNY